MMFDSKKKVCGNCIFWDWDHCSRMMLAAGATVAGCQEFVLCRIIKKEKADGTESAGIKRCGSAETS